MQVKDYIEKLSKLNPNDEVVDNYWHEADVVFRAKDRGIELTKEQVEKIVYIIGRRFDASIGINWDVIDIHTDAVLEGDL